MGENKLPVVRDALVQGMLFDAALKDSFFSYTVHFLTSIIIIILPTIFGVSILNLLSVLLASAVVVMVMLSLRMDLSAIDMGLIGDSDGSTQLDIKKSRLLNWIVSIQTGSLLLYFFSLVVTFAISQG